MTTGNSFASPQLAGLCATLFDMLPSSLSDADRKETALDILLRTSDKVFRPAGGGTEPDPDNWGRINFRNAYGIPPTSVSVVTGTGSPTITDFWREDGTVTTIASDDGVGGTLRLKIDAVFHCPYSDPTTVGDLHFRFRVGGLNTTATVKLKHDNGTFSASTTIPVTTSPILSEKYFDTNYFTLTPNAQDYIDSSGNVTVRIEVPGPAQFSYSTTFDQLAARFLRASEEE